MNLLLVRMGRFKAAALITGLSIFLSLAMTSWLQALFGQAMKLSNFIPAFIAPLVIAAPISWYILGMLLHIHQLEQEMRTLAMKDPLTNLYNRRFFYEYMEKWICIAGCVEKPFAIVLMDIDHFKKVNDVYGHDAGDLVIQYVATLLTENLRKSDVICRFGGEEYAIGLIDIEQEAAQALMEKIRQQLATATIHHQKTPLSVTASIGIVHQANGKNVNLDHLIHLADKALYQAKNTGRNRVYTHEQNPSDSA